MVRETTTAEKPSKAATETLPPDTTEPEEWVSEEDRATMSTEDRLTRLETILGVNNDEPPAPVATLEWLEENERD